MNRVMKEYCDPHCQASQETIRMPKYFLSCSRKIKVSTVCGIKRIPAGTRPWNKVEHEIITICSFRHMRGIWSSVIKQARITKHTDAAIKHFTEQWNKLKISGTDCAQRHHGSGRRSWENLHKCMSVEYFARITVPCFSVFVTRSYFAPSGWKTGWNF